MVARGDGSVALVLAVNELKKLLRIRVPYSLLLRSIACYLWIHVCKEKCA